MTENKPNTSSIFHTDFLPFAIRWGRGLSLFGIVLAFGPCLGLAVMGIFPSVSGVMAGIAAQLPAVVAAYFYEPISYFAILGIAGTYMGFLSGNVNNMRAPCASIAQSAANVEEGSDEGGIIATVGIAVSIFINIAVKAKLFCPEIAGLFCRIAGLFCHDSRANLSLKPVCFGIAIS